MLSRSVVDGLLSYALPIGAVTFVVFALAFLYFWRRISHERRERRRLSEELEQLKGRVRLEEVQRVPPEPSLTSSSTQSPPSPSGSPAASVSTTGPNPPDDLVKACLSGQCVLFAGAGLSMAAGMPSPLRLAEGMFDEFLKQSALDFKLESSLRALLERHESDVVVEGIVEGAERGPALALQYLQRALRWTGGEVPGVFTRLPEIGFSGVITTNFDDLLERSLALQPGQVHTLADTGRLLEALTKNDFFLLKLYGVLDRPDSIRILSS